MICRLFARNCSICHHHLLFLLCPLLSVLKSNLYNAGASSDAHPAEAQQITEADQVMGLGEAKKTIGPARARKALPGRLRKKIAKQKTSA